MGCDDKVGAKGKGGELVKSPSSGNQWLLENKLGLKEILMTLNVHKKLYRQGTVLV